MITKSDWQAVNQSLLVENRKLAGEPPTSEEALAYMRGELPADEEARVRERLVAYPELLRGLTAPFPTDGAEPGDDDYLSDAELADHWAKLQRRARRGRVVQFWPAIASIAAALAIVVFGGLFWQKRDDFRASQLRPRVTWGAEAIPPDGQRGGGDTAKVLELRGDSYSLGGYIADASFEEFRLAVADTAPSEHVLWKSSTLRPNNSMFSISIPKGFLVPGKYRVVLFGVSGAREERLATYTFRIDA